MSNDQPSWFGRGLLRRRNFLGAACLGWALLLSGVCRAEDPDYSRVADVIYGRKFGMALTMDVFQPNQGNGRGILLMVSGGYRSSHDAINPAFFQALMKRGYTVFAVVHGSQPRFIIPEIELDIHRAVRFIRHNAANYHVDPAKLGITGASSGGHLSLMLGTRGAPGKPSVPDPVDRESSEVQCVACFFPPTDFLNWGQAAEDGVGVGPTAQFHPAFGPLATTEEGRRKLGADISPINFVSSFMAPTLVIHGDADRVVPLFQAQLFEKRCKQAGAIYKLIVRPGKDHGWPEIPEEFNVFADWFDQYLRGIDPAVVKKPGLPPAAK